MSNMTVTIFSEEYRDLVKARCQLDMLVGLLIESSDLDYAGRLHVNGMKAAEFIQQIAPMAYEMKQKELKDEKANR